MLLTPGQVAEQLAIHPQTLKAWRRHKKGPPYIRVETDIRYDEEALRQWLQDRTVSA